MAATLEIFESMIVALGAFNPAIFTPGWLAQNNLIGKIDAESANERESLVIMRQVSVIETDWFILQVLEDKLTLASKGAVTPMIKDLAAGILSLIPQTPISAVGLNFTGHYKFENTNEYHKIGDVLAPKRPWEAMFPERAIGLINLTIKVQPCKRDEIPKSDDEMNIIVQPSTKIRGGGVSFTFNNHKDIKVQKNEFVTYAECAGSLIDEEWEYSRKRAIEVFEGLINAALTDGSGLPNES
ncbi:MAG: hypothetical protein PHT07_24875 [Paludibacter sp.]|nr:hypothetical protein [Paludibacter sp.]